MKNMRKLTKLGLAALLMAVLFASCVPQKKMLYLMYSEAAGLQPENMLLNLKRNSVLQ